MEKGEDEAIMLSENNCSDCFKHFELMELTIILEPEYQLMKRLCDNCLEKFKELTKDSKVCVEVSNDSTLLYCYRCGLKTKDRELFKKHDCIKTESSIKFLESILKADKNA